MTALAKKLGVPEGGSIVVLNAPRGYLGKLKELPKGAKRATQMLGPLDVIQYFAESTRELRAIFPVLKKELKNDGAVWIAWRKNSDDDCPEYELTQNTVRRVGESQHMIPGDAIDLNMQWTAQQFTKDDHKH